MSSLQLWQRKFTAFTHSPDRGLQIQNSPGWVRFQASGAKNGSNASRELLLSLVHEEDKERFLEALEEYPGILITFVNPILSGAGVSAELGK